MAKKSKKNEKFNYNASVNALKAEGPAGLYLIWGPEDYLADRFFEEIKKLCITSEADDFSYRRLDERDFSLLSLKEAIDSVPFLSERSLVEVRGVDINKLRESDEISAVLSDIPDYCTVVFMAPIGFEPDKRLKVYKAIQKYGKEICATAQGGDILIKWIIRRFAAEGKGIELNAVQRLINVSGELMNGLIPRSTAALHTHHAMLQRTSSRPALPTSALFSLRTLSALLVPYPSWSIPTEPARSPMRSLPKPSIRSLTCVRPQLSAILSLLSPFTESLQPTVTWAAPISACAGRIPTESTLCLRL